MCTFPAYLAGLKCAFHIFSSLEWNDFKFPGQLNLAGVKRLKKRPEYSYFASQSRKGQQALTISLENS
jgi:hypothetical protein